MPTGAVSSGPRPAATALAPGVPFKHPDQQRIQRQLDALNELSRLRMSKAPALLIQLFLHGPHSVLELAKALGWSTSATSYAVRTLSTGRYRNEQVFPPHAVLLWIDKPEGSYGSTLRVSLRPEAVQLCHDLIGFQDPSAGNA